MTDLVTLAKRNAERWSAARLTRASEFTPVAARLAAPAAKSRYQAIEARTGVPWYFVAVTHQRESSQRWDRQLGQGDPLDRVSTHDPVGRGPFKTFEDSAVDALVNCGPHAAHNKDWSVGGLLTMLEQYNGLAYANHGVPSPYVWSGTDQYKLGKVLVDHGPIEPVEDKQLGCAGLLLAMMAIDPSIRFASAKPVIVPPLAPAVLPPAKPAVSATTKRNATTGSAIVAAILAALQANKIEIIIAILIVGVLAAVVIHKLWPKDTP